MLWQRNTCIKKLGQTNDLWKKQPSVLTCVSTRPPFLSQKEQAKFCCWKLLIVCPVHERSYTPNCCHRAWFIQNFGGICTFNNYFQNSRRVLKGAFIFSEVYTIYSLFLDTKKASSNEALRRSLSIKCLFPSSANQNISNAFRKSQKSACCGFISEWISSRICLGFSNWPATKPTTICCFRQASFRLSKEKAVREHNLFWSMGFHRKRFRVSHAACLFFLYLRHFRSVWESLTWLAKAQNGKNLFVRLISNSAVQFQSDSPQLDAGLDLMRRLSPQKCTKHLNDIINMCPQVISTATMAAFTDRTFSIEGYERRDCIDCRLVINSSLITALFRIQ